jgi:hypothetical protein
LTIKPNSPLGIRIRAHYRIIEEPLNRQTIYSIDKIRIKYYWIKKESKIPCAEEIPISCEIIEE